MANNSNQFTNDSFANGNFTGSNSNMNGTGTDFDGKDNGTNSGTNGGTNSYNINIFEKNKDVVRKADNSSQEYIILQNEALTNQNKGFIVEIQQLKIQIDELEEESDRYEKSKTYMRGLLKNFVEMNKDRNLIIQEYSKYIQSLDTYFNTNYNNNLFLDKYFKLIVVSIASSFMILYMCNIISFYTLFISYTIIYSSIVCNILHMNEKETLSNVMLFKFNFNNNFKSTLKEEPHYVAYSNFKKKMKESNKRILEVEKANDFINDYCDVI